VKYPQGLPLGDQGHAQIAAGDSLGHVVATQGLPGIFHLVEPAAPHRPAFVRGKAISVRGIQKRLEHYDCQARLKVSCHQLRHTVGIRVPDHPIALGLVGLLGHPILTTTAALPDEAVESDPYEIEAKFKGHLALVIDGGIVLPEPSSIISMIDDAPEVIREGKGDVSGFA